MPDPAKGLLIEEEMKESYLTYAMSVLVDRALPDIRDGFKPVHRRILYSMRDLNLGPGQKYQKSARIVGHCIGNYHPHGDSAVYDAMVRMAQDFSLRYELVDGQGNFGSIDGDPPAAYRYTEARMTRMAAEMMEDIQYDTVDHRPNFDERVDEPVVLPAKFPNLLVNGSSGIAVGMATNIPPHSLREVCAAAVELIDNPAATVDDLMKHIRAPDFPTGGFICGTGGVRQAYETGRGRLVMRARIHTEEVRGRESLVVTEIPYGIKLSTVYESIGKADRDGHITGISAMHGGTVKEGIRLVLELKRGEDPDVVLNQLWKHTNLQYSFSFNMIALDGGRPRTVGLRRLLQAWIAHRREVIVRRTRFLLARDEARLHIVQGLLRAIDIIDEIIALIRAAASADEAKQQLIERYEFSERQAQAILDMQLRRLTGLERDKLIAERDELEARIADYRDILAREERQYGIIKQDLTELSDKYGDERRTELTHASGDLNMEDLIEDTECVVTITNSGYIKRLPADTYRTQRRGGKGVIGGKLKDDDDFVAHLFLATNHQYLLVFTSAGKLHWLKVYDVPLGTRTGRGKALANVLNLPEGERISAIFPVRDFPDDRYLFMATASGTVKKCALSAFSRPRAGGIIALTLREDDELIGSVVTGGEDEILLATNDGKACRFKEGDVRASGRTSAGVRGISLGDGARVVSLVRCEPGMEVLSICERGYGKRTPIEDYRLTARGGKGVININTSERNGAVVASVPVTDDDQLLLMSRLGKVVRIRVADVRSTGRAAAGVTMIGMDGEDILVGIARCITDEDEDDEAAADEPTGDSGGDPAPETEA